MKKILPILITLIFFYFPSAGEDGTIKPDRLKKEAGKLEERVEQAAKNQFARDSNLFRPPTEIQRLAWNSVIRNILNQRPKEALRDLQKHALPYQIVLFRDLPTNLEYVLLEEIKPLEKGWGFYVFDLKTNNPLAIEVPHPVADARTEVEGIDAFLQTRASAFLMAGTHRRANKKETDCSKPGLGDNASGEATYPESDVAHNVSTVFHATHETLVTLRPKTVALQLHGMMERDVCPDVFMSSGAGQATSNTRRLFDCLKKQKVGSEIWKGNKEGCPLGATTNVQGRFSNNEKLDPCNTPAKAAPEPGFFIHVEQEPSVRRDKESWKPVIDALKCAFPW